MRILMGAALAATMLAGCSEAEPEVAEPEYTAQRYNSAVDDIARPPEDRERDELRKPGELLAFAEIDRGDVVGDYIMGGGYVTRLLSMAVGPEGKVYAFQPEEFISFRPEYAEEQDAAVAPYADDQGNPTYVVPLRGPITEPGFPEPLDTAITVMNLHDLYLPQMPEGTAEQAIQALYDSLKPGGTLVVVDHRAAEGAGVEAAESLHRMDEQVAMDALTSAGFVLEEESEIYTRPEDPRDASVFDESNQGRTDQFAWRFRKPE